MGDESAKTSREHKSSLSFNDALSEVIKNLKGQPVFLFILGVGILFLAAGSVVKDFQPILLPLGAIAVLGIVIWGFLETQKLQSGTSKSGDVRIDKGARAREVEAGTGDVTGSNTGKAASGDITIGSKADLQGVKIKTGSVRIDTSSKSGS